MTARAQWFIEAVEGLDDEDDPFAAPIEEVGERINLRDPRAALELRLRELIRREDALAATGVRCPIKDHDESICNACPVSMAHDREQAIGTLCRIGREQEAVITELAVLACRDG